MGPIILVAFTAYHAPTFWSCNGIWQITWIFSIPVACVLSLCNHWCETIIHPVMLRVNCTIMNISKKTVTKVMSWNWICRLKIIHHQYFVQTNFQEFCGSEWTPWRHWLLGTVDKVTFLDSFLVLFGWLWEFLVSESALVGASCYQ